jgi:ribosomal protein S18 acetylase RimI-like enzyme
MDITIRRFSHSDIESINRIFHQTVTMHNSNVPGVFRVTEQHYWSVSFLEELSKSKNGLVLVAEDSWGVVGYLISYMSDLSVDVRYYRPRNILWIEDISVEKTFQGKGIGSLLLKECERWARSNGYTDIELNVYEFNRRAHGLYERHGYRKLSEILRKKL